MLTRTHTHTDTHTTTYLQKLRVQLGQESCAWATRGEHQRIHKRVESELTVAL